MTPSIAPFYRHGAPVPLTADDYAIRARVSLPDAKSALQRLIYAGLVSADRPHGRSLMVYEIIPAALMAADARKTAAALRDAEMVDRINRKAAA